MPQNRDRATPPPRPNCTVTRTTLNEQEDPVLPGSMSPIERMHAVWELSQEIYAIAGGAAGSLPRDQWPVRIIRPSA